MLEKNRKAGMALLKVLEPRILGKTRPAWQCSCGAIHHGPATAVEIEPGGDEYPGQETFWVCWSVKMSEHPDVPGYSYSCGLSEFIPVEELKTLFAKYFGPEAKIGENPFELKVRGENRVDQMLPAAVRIRQDDAQIRFSFDWGRNQEEAELLSAIERASSSRDIQGPDFRKVLETLASLKPETYIGGPKPELPFESLWRDDYPKALAEAAKADKVFLQNICYTFGAVFQTDVVFWF